jgi:hypothetical protein
MRRRIFLLLFFPFIADNIVTGSEILVSGQITLKTKTEVTNMPDKSGRFLNVFLQVKGNPPLTHTLK